MAKAQKSVLLSEDLVRLLAHFERRHGTTFTRSVTAAILQYLFEKPEGPDPFWMETVIALENGEITLADIPRERMSVTGHDRLLWTGFKYMAQRKEEDPVERIIAHWEKRPTGAAQPKDSGETK